MFLFADGIAGRNVLEADGGADIARENLADVFALVGMHLQQTANALLVHGPFSTESPDLSWPE